MNLEKNPRVGEACIYETELELKQVKYIEELEKANNELREKLGERIEQKRENFYNLSYVYMEAGYRACMKDVLLTREFRDTLGDEYYNSSKMLIIKWGEPIPLPVNENGSVEWGLVEGDK